MVYDGCHGTGVIGQFHNVVEVPLLVVTADLEDVHESFMRAGDWFELLEAFEFAFVIGFLFKRLATNDFDRAEGSYSIARKPDFAIATGADGAQKFMIGNPRRRQVSVGPKGGGKCGSYVNWQLERRLHSERINENLEGKGKLEWTRFRGGR